MAKIERTNAKKNTTFIKPGRDLIRVMMRLFILGIALIERNGRKILSILRTLIPLDSIAGIKSTILTHTITKSSQFQ
jgi:hypothetical protein